jgi:hypothetical protein
MGLLENALVTRYDITLLNDIKSRSGSALIAVEILFIFFKVAKKQD